MTRIDYLVVHCSATPAALDIGAAEIRKWHRERGWRDIGYHYVIRRDGTVETGRPETTPGAHEPKVNRSSVAVCLVGGSPPSGTPAARKGLGENNFTPAQFEALAALLGVLRKKYPKAEILGHRDIPGVRKACPSFDVKSWLASIQL